jgi:hypothetical protein
MQGTRRQQAAGSHERQALRFALELRNRRVVEQQGRLVVL